MTGHPTKTGVVVAVTAVAAATGLLYRWAAAPASAPSRTADGPGTWAAKVTHVADGDTATVRLIPSGETRTVRVLGIDCPESRWNEKCRRDGRQGRMGCLLQVPLGRAATERARELLGGRRVTLEAPDARRGFREDRYGRLLAYVRLPDGEDYGLRMISEARCWDFGWRYPHPRGAAYRAAEARWRAPGAATPGRPEAPVSRQGVSRFGAD